tara:strand:- start:1014 stop:1463 length:450 start_codon:yes stop_codon:yes gene_type:complete
MPNVIEFLGRVASLSYEATLTKVWNDKRVQAKIIELNTRKQLFDEGLKSDGSYLPDYSDVSVREYGKPSGHIRLFETGEFFDSFRIIVFGSIAEIVADTIKNNPFGEDTDLAKVYNNTIIGLTDESKTVLKEIIYEVTKEIIWDYLRIS